MAYATINDPSAQFQSLLYTGNSSTQSVTFDGNSNLQPDWVWTKCRSNTSDNFVFDSNRGVHKRIFTNTTAAEVTNTNALTSFDSDGFSMGNVGGMNFSSQTQVGWGWKSNGGTTSSNSNGTITSTVQANTDAGFSIISYTGNGTNGATIGHGLNATPEIFFPKCLSTTTNWEMYYFPTGGTKQYGYLNLTNGFQTWSYTAPTSTTIGLSGSGDSNGNGRSMIGYAFHSVQGYSKIGTYTGNGNADGPFIYTGFKPAWVLWKETTSSNTNDWYVLDNKRDPLNITDAVLSPNLNSAESDGSGSYNGIDILSNGFKVRTSNAGNNRSSGTYVYMTFAENPFVATNGVPATAR